jgi:hypothetical protein
VYEISNRSGEGDTSVRARFGYLRAAAALLIVSCGGDASTAPEAPLQLSIGPTPSLLVGVESSVKLVPAATRSGVPVDVPSLDWTSSDASVATVSGGLVSATGAGDARITATGGGTTASADVEVFVPEEITELVPGTTHLGRAGYVEFIVGELPVVISAPHGGERLPAEIPDRTYGVTSNDLNTQELTRAVRAALIERTGMSPHVVISRLRRQKLDPNREVAEAAQGNQYAEQSWSEFHGFIELAEAEVERNYGSGLYIDMHGHGHPIPRLELGYLLGSEDLGRSDASLDATAFAEKSSLRALAETSGLPFSQLVRGPTSFGALIADRSVRAVPSPGEPDPGSDPYFSGGYNTARHGSRDGGTMSGIQIEHHYAGLRDTSANRQAYAAILADVIIEYLEVHYGFVP